MFATVLLKFVDIFVAVFTVLLIVRVVASYVANPGGRFLTSLVNITEPVIAPVRRLLPQTAGLDLAPLVTYILLRVIQYVFHSLLGA